MANPFVKYWKYLMAKSNDTIDRKADPRIQIQQAVEQEKKRHSDLTKQAAMIMGNEKQLKIRLSRKLEDLSKLQNNTRSAITLADKAAASGDEKKALEYTNSAESFANNLVSTEAEVESLKSQIFSAENAAEKAKQAVVQSESRLGNVLTDQNKLVQQLEQAKMQERVAESTKAVNELSAAGNTPTLDQVRDKIEKRYATALGSAELSADSTSAKMMEIEQASTQIAGKARLEQIRQQMLEAPKAE